MGSSDAEVMHFSGSLELSFRTLVGLVLVDYPGVVDGWQVGDCFTSCGEGLGRDIAAEAAVKSLVGEGLTRRGSVLPHASLSAMC